MGTRSTVGGIALTTALACVLAPSARADDDGCSLLCEFNPTAREVEGFTAAKVDYRPRIDYPTRALQSWSEGFVVLEFSVAADGSVKNMKVVDALGPREFVDMSVRRIANWRYKPATRNGLATDQPLARQSVVYLFEDSGREAQHGFFIRKYNDARALISERKFDEAIETLSAAFKGRLNLYEQAMGSFVLALAHAQKGEWPNALLHIRHVYVNDGKFLEQALKGPALALQVEVEARTGNFHQALCVFEQLKKIDPALAAKSAANVVEQINRALQDPKPLVVAGQLSIHPLFDAPAVWRHELLRSKFSFSEIKGEVKSFHLACLGTSHEAPVDAEMIWNVPPKAGACILSVEGAPGATFLLVEEH